MRTFPILLAVVALLPSTVVFAHGDKGGGACKAYFEACKDDASVTGAAKGKAQHEAMFKCVNSAATAAANVADTADQGKACTAELAKRKARWEKHKEKDGGSTQGQDSGQSS